MNVQLAPVGIANRDRENFRLQPCPVAGLAWLPGHESADPVASELAFGFPVESFHLRHESLEGARRLRSFSVSERDRLLETIPVGKRLLEIIRQFSKGDRFIDPKMFYERAL